MHIGRYLQCICLVPATSIKHHDKPVIWMTSCYFVEKDLHTKTVEIGQDQSIKLSVGYGSGCVYINVFLTHHACDDGADRSRTPTPPYVRNASKPGLILEHNSKRFCAWPLGVNQREQFWEFFSTRPGLRGRLADAFYLEQVFANYDDAEDCRQRQEQLLCPSGHQGLV